MAATATWRSAVRTTLRPARAPMAAPRANAASAPMIVEATTALVPWVKNQGNKGGMAPSANDTNEKTAARKQHWELPG